tara:strand:- start:223 stop:423 length:201 start_codon:yes stop_codon:yes gene_type:complete
MCLVCIEYEKEKLTIKEGIRNIGEMRENVGEKHYDEVYNMLTEDLLKQQELNDYWSNYYEELGFGD